MLKPVVSYFFILSGNRRIISFFCLEKWSRQTRLSITDITGREIEILNEGYQAKGEYKYVFTPKSTANGIYFYKLQIDNKYVSGKLIYAK